MFLIKARIHKKLVRIANREDLDHCAVFLGLFGRLVFKFLEHLLYCEYWTGPHTSYGKTEFSKYFYRTKLCTHYKCLI